MRPWMEAFPPPEGTPDHGIEAPLEALATARRLDWRFLLPDPALERVAYIGPAGGRLSDALRRFAQEFVPVRSGTDPPEAGNGNGCDLAVVASRRLGDLREGFARLRPGGHLYWEVERRPRRLRPEATEAQASARSGLTGGFLRNPRHVLHSLGFDDVRIGLALPDSAEPKIMLSPDPTAVRFVLEMMSRRRLFALDHLISITSRAGLLHRAVPSLRIVARRPGGKHDRTGVAAATFLSGQMRNPELDGLPWVLLSRRAASFAITFLLRPGADRPAAVIKSVRLPRHARAERALDREATGLEAVSHARPAGIRSTPRVLGRGPAGGTRHLALSGEPGRVFGRRELGRDPEAWTGTVVDWLIGLHKATQRPSSEAGERHEKLVDRPMRQLELGLPRAEVHAELLGQARHVLESLGPMAVPTVLEHGDVCASNILTGQGRITVIDWEFSEPRGFPGTDLFFFLASMALAREDARTWDEKLGAMRKAFARSGGWAREWISLFWEELRLPPEAAEPLFVCCWTRSLARLLRRPDKSLATAAAERGNGVLLQHHFFRFWHGLLTSPENPDLLPHDHGLHVSGPGR